MVDAAGRRHGGPVFSQDRHVGGPHAVQVGRHVVVLSAVAPPPADQTPQAVGEALLGDLLRRLVP